MSILLSYAIVELQGWVIFRDSQSYQGSDSLLHLTNEKEAMAYRALALPLVCLKIPGFPTTFDQS